MPKFQLQPPVRYEWISQHVLFIAATEKQWISDWWLWAEAIGTKSLRCVAVNATGRRVKLLSGLSGKCTSHALTMTIHPEAPDCACLSCLGWNQDPQLCHFSGFASCSLLGQCNWAQWESAEQLVEKMHQERFYHDDSRRSPSFNRQ